MNEKIKALKSFINDLTLWFAWTPLRYVIQYIPLKLSYKLSTIFAHSFFLFARNKRKIMTTELHRIFKDRNSEEIDWIAKKSFEFYVKRQVENLIYGTLNKRKIEKMVNIEGIENLNSALVKGKGVIILLSHFGSHLLILPALAFKGYHINQVTGPPVLKDYRPINRKIFKIRKRESDHLPVTFLRSDQSLYSAFKALKKNELVAFAFDGRIGEKWVSVNMFDMKAVVSPGPVRIAIKTGATIIPTFIIRKDDNTHKLILEPPFELEYFENKEKMVSVNLQKLAKIFEGYIQRSPCHYGMILQVMRDRARRGIIDYSLLQEKPTFINPDKRK